VFFATGKLKVLLVEQVQTYLELERTFLCRHNVAILEGPEDVSTVELVRRHCPRVVVIDVRTPDRLGFGLCRALKADEVASRVPVVLLVDDDDAREGIASGADALVGKPIQMRAFLDTVRKFVDLKERRSPRIPVNLRFTYRFEEQSGQAFSREISAYGVFLKTDLTAPEGALLNLSFRLPGEGDEIHCMGVVRLANEFAGPESDTSGLGIEFEHVEPEDQVRFQHFVDKSDSAGLSL
jgi:uncharacterized protein (TIGR02266 family)